jgi:hypothetical protein
MAAWLGLVPQQYSTGGRTQMLGINKRGNRYVRRLLIHGARSCVVHLDRTRDRLGTWIAKLQSRMHVNKVTVAARADYGVVRFHSGFCRVWPDTAIVPFDGQYLAFHRYWGGHHWWQYRFPTAAGCGHSFAGSRLAPSLRIHWPPDVAVAGLVSGVAAFPRCRHRPRRCRRADDRRDARRCRREK